MGRSMWDAMWYVRMFEALVSKFRIIAPSLKNLNLNPEYVWESTETILYVTKI